MGIAEPFLVLSIFTLAMLIHAYRSGAGSFWYFLILFFQPLGARANFVLIVGRTIPFSGAALHGTLL